MYDIHSTTCLLAVYAYVVRQESNETGAIFFYLTFTYK